MGRLRIKKRRKSLMVGDAPGGNYELGLLGLSPKPGSLFHVEVQHDAWCSLLAGAGPCNCRPILKTRSVEPPP